MKKTLLFLTFISIQAHASAIRCAAVVLNKYQVPTAAKTITLATDQDGIKEVPLKDFNVKLEVGNTLTISSTIGPTTASSLHSLEDKIIVFTQRYEETSLSLNCLQL